MSKPCDPETATQRREREIVLLSRAMRLAVKRGKLDLARKHSEAIRDLRILNQACVGNFLARRYVMGINATE